MSAPDRDKPLKPGLARAAIEMLGDLRRGEVHPDAPTVAAPLPDSATPPTLRSDTGAVWRPRVPRSLGPYDLLEELGHGGMGVVYRARHMHLGTIRVVKVLIAGEHASVESIMRFQREAAAVARMGKHPNIVSVHDLGEERGIAWYAMEFVEGKALRDRLKEKEYGPEDAARLMEKVARALHYAHGHGIVHRDVKPENIVVGENGEPQVMDFGLARDVESHAKLSVVGAAMGTPNYMAPEQVEGKHQECDARTDVYAVGATLYEVLTGAFAHPGHAVAQVFEHIRRGDIVPPRRLRPAAPWELEAICMKCLQRDPAQRYQDAQELADDLARYVAGDPIRARRLTVARAATKWLIRRWRPIVAGLLVILASGAGTVWLVGEVQARRQRTREEEHGKVVGLLAAEHLPPAGQAFTEAEKLIRSGVPLTDPRAAALLRSAATHCSRVLDVEPNHESALSLRAQARFLQGDLSGSLRDYDAVLGLLAERKEVDGPTYHAIARGYMTLLDPKARAGWIQMVQTNVKKTLETEPQDYVLLRDMDDWLRRIKEIDPGNSIECDEALEWVRGAREEAKADEERKKGDTSSEPNR